MCRKQRKPVLSLVPKKNNSAPPYKLSGLRSMSTPKPASPFKPTLDIGYFGTFISSSRWPRSSRRWVLNRCAGGCPHICLRGVPLRLGDGALGRKRCCQNYGLRGGAICTLIPVLVNFSGGHWEDQDREGKTEG